MKHNQFQEVCQGPKTREGDHSKEQQSVFSGRPCPHLEHEYRTTRAHAAILVAEVPAASHRVSLHPLPHAHREQIHRSMRGQQRHLALSLTGCCGRRGQLLRILLQQAAALEHNSRAH